jgi:NAD(P)-dependent dehydrogenase (short-subunit alcohol dehydrogenase family)
MAIHYHRPRAEAQALYRDIRDSFGRDVELFQADLGDPGHAARMVDTVARTFGSLHVLVNNASLYEKNTFGETSRREWDRHMNVNLRAPFFLSQAAAPHMRRAGGGKIINIGDWAAERPYADYIPYCISKAGLLCLNTALAKALSPDIQVNAVLPGPVMLPEGTSRSTRAAIARATLVKRLGSPDDVAQAVIFLLESGDFITGAALPVDGGRMIA